jgi:hypothetical protein
MGTLKAKFIYESLNFERGVDPKSSMKLGIRNKRSFKTVKECAKFFIDHIDKLSEGRYNNIEEFKEIFSKSGLKMSKDYLDGFRVLNSSDSKYPPIYTEEWGTDFANVQAKLAALRDFHLEIQNYMGLRDPNKPLSEAINFERGMDPKVAMDLGWRAQVINWFNEPHAFEDFYNGFYNLLPKKISRFTTDHWLIRHIAKFVGHTGKDDITPEQFTDLLAIILYNKAGKEADEVFKFSKYEDINGYDDQVTEGNLDSTVYSWSDEGILKDAERFKKELEKFPNDMYDCIQTEEAEEAEDEKTQKRISN